MHDPDSATATRPALRFSAAPVLRVSAVRKSYGGVHALRGADFLLDRPGEIHTLIGENGSGKSTLLGILSGQLRPDAGTVELDGAEVTFRDPVAALDSGVAMVSQETAIAPHLSVAENVLLGRTVRGRGGIDWAGSYDRAREVLAGLGLSLDPRISANMLRPDELQMVEIARAISLQARVLILDEPTSSLTDDEVEHLFGALKTLSDRGVCIVFVSHRLPEVFRISNSITVLRDGVTVDSGPVDRFTPESLVRSMIGDLGRRSAVRHRPTAGLNDDRSPEAAKGSTPCAGPLEPTLEVSALSHLGSYSEVDLTVGGGEVVGLAGLVGSGRSELLESLFGVRTPTGGSVRLNGQAYRPTSTTAAIGAGVGYLPPDRKSQGLVLAMSVGQNLSMAATCTATSWRAPDRARESDRFATARETMRLKSANQRVPVATLSGGNQQKVALAKWLAIDPALLLLDDPTRGVDVAAKSDIHARLRALADDGLSVLVSSSEMPELLELCDRIVVMFRGRVVATLDCADTDEATITRLAGGHQ